MTTVLRNLQYVLVGLIAVVFVLAILARRYPHIHWLQHFRPHRPYDPRLDRKLDTAWMEKVVPPRLPQQEPIGESVAQVGRQFREQFSAAWSQVPPEQRARQRRRSNVYAGVQLIGLGILLPFGFHILKMMLLFSAVSRTENAIVLTASGVCIVLGIIAIVRSGKN